MRIDVLDENCTHEKQESMGAALRCMHARVLCSANQRDVRCMRASQFSQPRIHYMLSSPCNLLVARLARLQQLQLVHQTADCHKIVKPALCLRMLPVLRWLYVIAEALHVTSIVPKVELVEEVARSWPHSGLGGDSKVGGHYTTQEGEDGNCALITHQVALNSLRPQTAGRTWRIYTDPGHTKVR